MGEDRGKRFDGGTKGKNPPRQSVNIRFARGLSSKELLAILQLQLIRARNQKPAETEVTLPTEVVHDLKFRLRYYSERYGEIDRKGLDDSEEEGGKDGDA